jgi:putative transposase
VVGRVRRKSVLPHVRKVWQLSERRACEILGVNRRAVRYRSVRGNVDVALRAGIKAIVAVRIRYGQRRIHVLLKREGWRVNIKRVARLYREEGLAIRTKIARRRRAAVVRETLPNPAAVNQSWAMDFMHDVLADGTKIRLLTIVDIFRPESVALEVDFGFKSPQVVDVLRRVAAERGKPQRVRCD